MHLCHRSDVAALIQQGTVQVETDDGAGVRFLDEHRLALRLGTLYRLEGAMDLSAVDPPPFVQLPVEDSTVLLPGVHYLGLSRERLRLGPGVAATLHTRSTYARMGLEMLSSSNFVVPGFGESGLAPIVFEISVRLPTTGVGMDDVYSFALLYKLAAARETANGNEYFRRFPVRVPGPLSEESAFRGHQYDPVHRPVE